MTGHSDQDQITGSAALPADAAPCDVRDGWCVTHNNAASEPAHDCYTDPACCKVCETHNGCRCDDVRYE